MHPHRPAQRMRHPGPEVTLGSELAQYQRGGAPGHVPFPHCAPCRPKRVIPTMNLTTCRVIGKRGSKTYAGPHVIRSEVWPWSRRSRSTLRDRTGSAIESRSTFYAGALPDRITIYRRAICAVCNSDSEVFEQVRRTAIHEWVTLRDRRRAAAGTRLASQQATSADQRSARTELRHIAAWWTEGQPRWPACLRWRKATQATLGFWTE